jgi:hypothetical protein
MTAWTDIVVSVTTKDVRAHVTEIVTGTNAMTRDTYHTTSPIVRATA